MAAANENFTDEDGELRDEDDDDDDDDDERSSIELENVERRRVTIAAAGPQTPPEPHQMIVGNDSDDGQEDALTIKPPQAQTHKERAERGKERAERRDRKSSRKSSEMPHRSKDRHRARSTGSNARSSDRPGRGSGSRGDRRGGDARDRRRNKDVIAKEGPDTSSSMGRRGGRVDDVVVLTKDSTNSTSRDRPDRSRDREDPKIRERDRLERMESEKRRDRLIYAERERERQRERQKRELEGRRQQDSSDSHSRERSPVSQKRPKIASREVSSKTKRQSPRVDAGTGAKAHQEVEQVLSANEEEEHLVIVASDQDDDDDFVEEIIESDGDAIVVEELSEQSAGEVADEGPDDEVDDNEDEEEKDTISVNGGSDASSNASSDKMDTERSGSDSTPQSRGQNSPDEQNGDDGDDDDTDEGEMTKDEGENGDDAASAAAYLVDDSPPSKPEPQLPPYLPAIQGCRNVEEFDCLNRIEEGTYGVVYRARHKKTLEIVALKRLKMEKERDGFPITSLREINTLLKAQHPNIVTVREIVVGSNMDKIYIVMDYVEHDLKSLMETMRQPFLIGEVKTLMIQLLRAVAHLHDNWILHRDLKTSNLLLSHKGVLKVGDFGLAREYGSPLKHYTPVVVTLWYRAPELLLGSKDYSTPIDVWSVGCIFGELLTMKPLFPGKSDINQLNCIFKDMGTPNEQIWPGYTELPMVKRVTFTDIPYSNLRRRFEPTFTNCGMDLLNKLLYFDPKRRVSAEEALKHKYFAESPKPVDPSLFPTWPAKSELAAHVRQQQSPKPPSGGKQYAKQLANDDDDVACAGFHMGEPQDTAVPRAGEMFRLRF